MSDTNSKGSNHYHGDHWDLFKVPEVERAPEWDGHTPQQASDRLEKYLRKCTLTL